jgi:hypothetical protein
LDRPAGEWAETTIALQNLQRDSYNSAALARVEESRFNLDHCVSTLRARYMELATR